MEHNKAAGVDYLHKKFSPLALTVTDNNDQICENLTPILGGRLARSALRMQHNKVPTENYLQ